jgi:hypothetical protein
MKRIEELTQENINLKEKVRQLEERIDDSDQYSRLNTVEIHGVPQEENENVMEVVKKLGVALDMPITEEMVDACHRLRRKQGDGRAPGIVVKFVRRLDRQKLIEKRKVKRTLNTGHIGYSDSTPIYINESLTYIRRKLLATAREMRKEKGYRFIWIKEGKIFVRKEENSPVIVLTRNEDIAKL